MSGQFLGEIRLVSFNFAPNGWALCNGQVLAISTNNALFQLLGTTYGGNGTTNFALPDFRSRVPVHQGQGSGLSNYAMGGAGGEEAVVLTSPQLAKHFHLVHADGDPADNVASNPSGHLLAPVGANLEGANHIYSTAAAPANNVTMNPAMIGTAGKSEPHDNLQPYLTVSFIIALFGIFPSQN